MKKIIIIIISLIIGGGVIYKFGLKISVHDEDKAKIKADKFITDLFIEKDYSSAMVLASTDLEAQLDKITAEKVMKQYEKAFGKLESIKTTNYVPAGKKGFVVFSTGENSRQKSYFKTYLTGTLFIEYEITGVYFSDKDYTEGQKFMSY